MTRGGYFGTVRFLAVIAALASCDGDGLSAPPPSDVVARDARTIVDPTEVVALAGGPAAANRLVAGATQRRYRLQDRDDLVGLDLVLLTFRLPPDITGPEAVQELEALVPGVTVGLNHAYRTGPGLGGAGARVYADALLDWPDGGCPAYVPVGVIDADLDTSAAALRGAEVVSRGFSEGGSESDDHGTAVAELLAGPGRLREASLFHAAVVGDVTGADPAAGVDDIMSAIGWLYESGVRLVNVSLAGPYNKILDRGLSAAAQRGMVIVAAAGNDGLDAPPRYPAAFDFVIAVTAVDADLEAYERAPRGDHIDFAAPGVDVFVPLDRGGRYMSGTSIAAPFVTALIASSPEADGIGSVASVRARLAQESVDLGTSGRDDIFGAGLAQASAPCRS